MTKQDLIEEIKHNMPEGLSKLEKARYVYIELGKQRAFDTKYFYGNSKARKAIQREAEKARINPDKFHNKKELVCISMAYLYTSILRELGIDCLTTRDEGAHTSAILCIDDEENSIKRIRADLSLDLPNIQSGQQTEHFGTKENNFGNYDTIDSEHLKQIDKKIRYINEQYRDVKKIKIKVLMKNATQGLKTVLEAPEVYENTDFQGHVERRAYYMNIIKNALGKYFRKKIYLFTCYKDIEKQDGNPKREYTLCAYSYEKNQVNVYLYSEKEERFLPVSLDKLIEFQNEGLEIGMTPKVKGANQLKKIMKDYQKNKENVALHDEI